MTPRGFLKIMDLKTTNVTKHKKQNITWKSTWNGFFPNNNETEPPVTTAHPTDFHPQKSRKPSASATP